MAGRIVSAISSRVCDVLRTELSGKLRRGGRLLACGQQSIAAGELDAAQQRADAAESPRAG